MIVIFIFLIIAMVLVVKYCKKAVRVVLSTLIILSILYLIIISIDINRVKTFREPIFTIASEKKDNELYSETICKGLGYTVKIDYIQNEEIGKITMYFMKNNCGSNSRKSSC